MTNGQNMYIHAGLFLMADHENEITGVIAHETGHIKGGHLARMKERLKNTQNAAMAGMALGVLAMFGGGDSAQAGMALMMGTSDIATKSLLSYSREEERMADEIGLQILDATDNSAQGFLGFMTKLNQQSKLLLGENISPYYMSHPLTQDRESYLEERMRKDSDLNKKLEKPSEQFQWVKAKITGYFLPSEIKGSYAKETDYKHYAQSFAYLRQKKYKEALKPIKYLLNKYPKNGYFHETYAQILFGAGEIKAAIKAYEKALIYTDQSPLIQLEYVSASLEDKNVNLDSLQTQLSILLMEDPSLIYAYQLLGIIYGKQKKPGLKAYALAEYNAAIQKKEEAKKQIYLAEKTLDKNSIEYLRLMDLKEALKKKDR